MPTIRFDVNDRAERDAMLREVLPHALGRVQRDSPGAWGKMTSQQMIEHLEWAFAISTGRIAVACAVPDSERDRVLRFLFDDRPTPREFMNPLLAGGLPPMRHPNLEAACRALMTEVNGFLAQVDATPGAVRVHPIFGVLSLQGWTRSHYKHVYHHLLQFGLLPTSGAALPGMSD